MYLNANLALYSNLTCCKVIAVVRASAWRGDVAGWRTDEEVGEVLAERTEAAVRGKCEDRLVESMPQASLENIFPPFME